MATNYQDWKSSFLQAVGSMGSTTSTKSPLTRGDFRKIHLKYAGARHYFSYSFQPYRELCLEPCMNGFEVAIYNRDQLLLNKVCTGMIKNIFKQKGNDKTNDKNLITIDLQHTLERSEETWDKAIDIANKLLTQLRNTEKISRMGLKKPDPNGIDGGPATLPKGVYPFQLDPPDDWANIKPAPMPTYPPYKAIPYKNIPAGFPDYSTTVTDPTAKAPDTTLQGRLEPEDCPKDNPVVPDQAASTPNKMDLMLDKMTVQEAELRHLRDTLASSKDKLAS